jgi:hypothetical protein
MSTPSTVPAAEADDEHVLSALYGDEADPDSAVGAVLLGWPDVPEPTADDLPGDEMTLAAEQPVGPAQGTHDARR